MRTLILIKIIRDTNLWKKGQKTWVIFGTGALAAYVLGRHKGTGKWIVGWAHYADIDGKGFLCKPDAKWIGKVEIKSEFFEYLQNIYRRKNANNGMNL